MTTLSSYSARKPNATPFVLLALLLLTEPLLLTLRKLVALVVLGERSHQLPASIYVVHNLVLYRAHAPCFTAKAERHAVRVARGVVGDRAAAADTAKDSRARRTRGTDPPRAGDNSFDT